MDRWETSDPHYDARTSEKLNDHLEELANKPAACIDNDYLNFHRLLAGQYAIHKPRRLEDNQSVEQQTAITTGNPDPPEGDRNQNTEIDRVASTRSHECNITGDLNIEGDRDVSHLIVKPLSLEGDAMCGDAVQDRQAKNVEHGREQKKRRNQHTEIDQEYSISAANIPGNENGEMNIERDLDIVRPPLTENVHRNVRRRNA